MDSSVNASARAPTEGDLVRRCRKGDRDAQHELYSRTSERIYALLYRMTRNQDDAFDLAQDTYLKGFSRIDRFDGRSSIATWFYRIAVNEALQFLRRSKTIRLKREKLAPPGNGTSDTSDTTSTRLDVNEALTEMEPSDRVILLLRYQSGLDYRAMAEVIGCAEGTVASRLSRARERIREILRKSYGQPEEVSGGVRPKDSQ